MHKKWAKITLIHGTGFCTYCPRKIINIPCTLSLRERKFTFWSSSEIPGSQICHSIKFQPITNFDQYQISIIIKFRSLSKSFQVLIQVSLSNFGQYQISASIKFRPVSNFGQYQILASIKFRPVSNFGQYQISASIKFRPVSNFGQYQISVSIKFFATQGVAENWSGTKIDQLKVNNKSDKI